MNIFGKYTRKSLGANKVRTVVTIIGIILSVALFTAVAEGLASGIHYMVTYEEKTAGAFEVMLRNLDSTSVEKAIADDETKEYSLLNELGFGIIGSSNEYKPYLNVSEIDDNFQDMAAVFPTEGRLPENDSEILLPNHLDQNGGVLFHLGDTINIELGDRIADGEKLYRNNAYEENETIENKVSKTYLVVGFYDRLSFKIEDFECPGYMAFTKAADDDLNAGKVTAEKINSYTLFVDVKHDKEAYDYAEKHINGGTSAGAANYVVHHSLLAYRGYATDDGLKRIMYGFAVILFVLIFFGSVSLIYNSFNISVSERTKQFGILKSIGATKKQIVYSVFYEAVLLAVIAIPIGMIIGCVGIGTTLYFLKDLFSMVIFLENSNNIEMSLYIEPIFLLFVAVVGLFTTIISAMIPALRAVRVSPIESLRQSKDIAVRKRKIKTSRLTYKLFGFEGMLASKNFKRSRKKYRVTVFSIFVSIVLFISASSFSSYLVKSSDIMSGGVYFDAQLQMTANQVDAELLLKKYREIEGVKSVTYFYDMWKEIKVPDTYFNKESQYYNPEAGATQYTQILFIDDDEYNSMARKNHVSLPDDGTPYGILFGVYTAESESGSNSVKMENMFLENEKPYEVPYYVYTDDGEELVQEGTFKIAGIMLEKQDISNMLPAIIYPMSEKDRFIDKEKEAYVNFSFFEEDDADDICTKAEELTYDEYPQLSAMSVINNSRERKVEHAMVTVINVFAYGFIILIALIATVNVFNTISTNVLLRKREFAMLRSIGMPDSGMNKMMNFECLLYGIKGLMYGIPAAVFVTYMLYKMIEGGIRFKFYVPASSVIISIVSVFVVVFITMLYSVNKIKKENTIDALKNENL